MCNAYLFSITIGFCGLVIFNEFIIHKLQGQRRFAHASTTDHYHFVKCWPRCRFFTHPRLGDGGIVIGETLLSLSIHDWNSLKSVNRIKN